MFRLNVEGGNVSFVDIRREDLPEIEKWYNHKEFMYATGTDGSIGAERLRKKRDEVVESTREFFAGIHLKGKEKIVGMLKGFLKDPSEDAVWIKTMMIEDDYQNQGLGSEAINLLFSELKQKKNVQRVYLSVVEDNQKGVAFWKKHGFEEVKKIQKKLIITQKDENICIMKKELQ